MYMKNLSLMLACFSALTIFAGSPGSLPGRTVVKIRPAVTYLVKRSPEVDYVTGIYIYRHGQIRVFDYGRNRINRYIPFPKEQVRALVKFIVDKQDFFSISQNDIRLFQKSREQKLDASTTRIRVWCRKGYHKVQVYDFPRYGHVSPEAVARLQRIVRRLEDLRRKMLRKVH